MGASRGGEAALLVGTTFASKVAATIAVVPSGYVWPAWGYWTSSSWTYQGNPLTFVPWANTNAHEEINDAGMDLFFQNSQFEDSLQLATAPQLSAAQIPVAHAQGPVLMFASAEDGTWPSCELAGPGWADLQDAGHLAAHPLDSFDCFPGAGHAVNPARAGIPIGITLFIPLGNNQFIAKGGTARDTAHASRQAHEKVLALLTWLAR